MGILPGGGTDSSSEDSERRSVALSRRARTGGTGGRWDRVTAVITTAADIRADTAGDRHQAAADGGLVTGGRPVTGGRDPLMRHTVQT